MILRVECLRHLAQLFAGQRATLDDLMDFVNQSWQGRTAVINETWLEMGALIFYMKAGRRSTQRLPLLTQLRLLYTGVIMVHLSNQLIREEQRQLVVIGALRRTVTSEPLPSTRSRPVPARSVEVPSW